MCTGCDGHGQIECHSCSGMGTIKVKCQDCDGQGGRIE